MHQSMESLTITADELAELLQPPCRNRVRWLQRHHERLTSEDGMPKKLPGGWTWSRLAVMAWIATYGAPRQARIEAADTLIRQQQKQLMEAFSGRAA